MKYFSICTIFKHEEPYIADWVKYHLGIGAEHIWMYNNDSPDKSADIARDVGKHQVTVHRCPGHPVQHIAYQLCLQTYRLNTRWLLFLDIDEYLISFTPIHEVLKAYEQHPALCPHWILFGSNGHLNYCPDPVPLRFTRSQSDVNPHVKSIVNTTRTFNWITAHRFVHDARPVDENHNPIEMLDSTPAGGTADVLYVAHYFTKSKEEFTERRSRPRPDTGDYRYNLEEAFATHDRNDRDNFDVRNIWKELK